MTDSFSWLTLNKLEPVPGPPSVTPHVSTWFLLFYFHYKMFSLLFRETHALFSENLLYYSGHSNNPNNWAQHWCWDIRKSIFHIILYKYLLDPVLKLWLDSQILIASSVLNPCPHHFQALFFGTSILHAPQPPSLRSILQGQVPGW